MHSHFNHVQLKSIAVYNIGYSKETKQKRVVIYLFKTAEKRRIYRIHIHFYFWV